MAKLIQALTLDCRERTTGTISTRDLLRRLFFSPGHRAVATYRVAVQLRESVPWVGVGRLVAALLISRMGRVPGVEFGSRDVAGIGLHMPHPHDIVIGRGARIGSRVTIFNGVTLGARRAPDEQDQGPRRYPVIEDDVVLYAGCKVLGPITIGCGSVVGANAVVLDSCPPGSVMVGVPAVSVDTDGEIH